MSFLIIIIESTAKIAIDGSTIIMIIISFWGVQFRESCRSAAALSAAKTGKNGIQHQKVLPEILLWRWLWWAEAGNPYWRGRISTVDLLVLTSSDQLLLMLKLYIFTKWHNLMRRSTVLNISFQLGFPGEIELTSLYKLFWISWYSYWNYIFLFYKTT